MEFKKVCILGMGYIGLPTAGILASRGVQVVGVDVNSSILETLSNGRAHIQEPGLQSLLTEPLRNGQLVVRLQPEQADAFLIAVPTPFQENKKADLSYVESAAHSITPWLRKGNLVVLESTSPPLTTVKIVKPILEEGGLKAGEDFYLAYSPERVLPGQILKELVENARVIGGIDPASAEAGRDLYRTFVKGQFQLTDATTAEMVKLMENTCRDVNIAIANEFSRLADRLGIDAWEAIRLANLHPRVHILEPGVGVGGHCISVDPWFLVEAAPDLARLIRTARQVNDSQPEFVAQVVKRTLGGSLAGRKIAALGLAYKPNVDDLRESPAISTCRLLARDGARVTAWEPHKQDARIEGVVVASSLEAALREAELLLLLVKHDSFLGLEPSGVLMKTNARMVMDCVNGWEETRWVAAGFSYHRLGAGQKG